MTKQELNESRPAAFFTEVRNWIVAAESWTNFVRKYYTDKLLILVLSTGTMMTFMASAGFQIHNQLLS